MRRSSLWHLFPSTCFLLIINPEPAEYQPVKLLNMAPKNRVSKHKTKVSTTREKGAHLLGIPPELRQQIYGAVLNTSPSSLYNLVLTNRHISRETKPYLFKQFLVFDGQTELLEWLRTIDHTFLGLVTDIQFKLHDIDPEGIVGALGKRLRQVVISNSSNRPAKDPYKEACDLELEHLEKAFRILPKVKRFTILATTKADSQPPCHMLCAFSDMLVRCFPNLISLAYHEDVLPIDFISPLHKLRRLRFPGITTNTPKRVTSIIGQLPSLVELEVCRPDPNSAERVPSVSRAVRRIRCDIPDIIRGISGLESLAFYEFLSKNNHSEAAQAEMTEAVMESINALERHKLSLRSLKILIDLDLQTWMRKKIAMFVKSSHLTHLETFDSDFPPLGYLPTTMETIVLRSGLLRVPFQSWLEEFVSMAQYYNYELPHLTEVVIYLNNPIRPSDEKHKGWASKEMRKLGIQLWWRRWDGTPPED